MKTIPLALLLSLGSSVAFGQVKEFNWLVGTWKLKDKNAFERWNVAKDGKSLEGISFRVMGNDTTATEQLALTFDGTSYHYIPDVAGQQGPVDFKITYHNGNSFVAENPAHDFPKIIRYTFRRQDRKELIDAVIEGDGKIIPFYFEKVE